MRNLAAQRAANGTRSVPATGVALVGFFPGHKSCPQYDRLKLLLHTGKSEIGWLRRAICRPAQLWNEGSTILYAENLPAASVIATWQISPRQPSTSDTASDPEASGPQAAAAGP